MWKRPTKHRKRTGELNLDFRARVYRIVRMVPKGKVVTYGQVALLLGLPRAARAVGWAMALTPGHLKVPCQRVIYGHGGLAGSYGREGLKEHKEDLEVDGVQVGRNYTVDLAKYQWWPDGETLKSLKLPPEALSELVESMPFDSGISYRPVRPNARQSRK